MKPRDNLTLTPKLVVSGANAKGRPTKRDISRVMASLGRRNKGGHKTMTPAAMLQRQHAAKRSAMAARIRRRLLRKRPYSIRELARPKSASPLAQSGSTYPGVNGKSH